MDVLNRGLTQAADLFQSMAPAARLATGVCLVVLVIGLAFVFRHDVEADGEYLFNAKSLSDPELARMEAAFADAGLEHGRRDGSRIRVPVGEASKYLKALNDAGALPETSRTAYDQMFANSSLMDPRHVTERRERQASEQTIERMIRDLTAVESATVRIEEVDQGGFPRRKARTAVAIVRAIGTKHLDQTLINTIRNIVAGASGAEPERITIADSNANLSFPGSGESGLPLAAEDPNAARVRLYEERTKRSIENMLAIYRGALVEVHAELSRDVLDSGDHHDYAARPVTAAPVAPSTVDSLITVPVDASQGRDTNGLGNMPKQVGDATNHAGRVASSVQGSVAPPESPPASRPNYAPVAERVTASIRIPRSLFRDIWMEENPPAGGESPVVPAKQQLEEIESRETQAIKEMVAALLPPAPPGEDPYSLVTVLPYTSTPIVGTHPTSFAGSAGSWFANNWQTVALLSVVVFGLCVFRSMHRASHRTPTLADASPPELAATENRYDRLPADEFELTAAVSSKDSPTEQSLRQKLAELVHEDPDAAATVLANWIGDAA